MKNILIILSIALAIVACNSKQTKTPQSEVAIPDTVTLVLHVEGMTCDHCEMTIQGSVKNLAGVIEIKADYEDSTTFVKYDASQISIAAISEAIEKKGYKVVK